jgi:hypothetical protein
MQTSAAERMRWMRARRKAQRSAPILYEREDWRLFIDPQTLPQKAGCEPDQIGVTALHGQRQRPRTCSEGTCSRACTQGVRLFHKVVLAVNGEAAATEAVALAVEHPLDEY